MKLAFLIGLLFTSASCVAVDLRFKDSGQLPEAGPAQTSVPAWLSSRLAKSQPIAFTPFGADQPLTIGGGTIGGGTSRQPDAFTYGRPVYQNSLIGSQSVGLDSGSVGFFTEFQFVIRQDLFLTGNWTRLHQSYNDSYDSNRILRPVEWSLITESRASTAKTVGLNWNIYQGWRAYAKLQTVNGSAWIPQLNIPRFVTQDAEDWTLAAVEIVYSF